MKNTRITTLRTLIIEGMKQSSSKLIERKILLKQKIAISNQGEIKLISPKRIKPE